MYSPASGSPMLANSGLSNAGDLDGGGTINPASLNPAGAFTSHLAGGQHHLPFSPPATATSEFHPDSKPRTGLDNLSPRGIKRSRSPDNTSGDLGAGTRFVFPDVICVFFCAAD